MIAGRNMTKQKVERLTLIIHQARDAAKGAIDVFAELLIGSLNVITENIESENLDLKSETPLIMDKKQLAKFLGVSETLISNLLKEDIPHRYFGRRVLFNREEVWEWAKMKPSQINEVQKIKLRVVR